MPFAQSEATRWISPAEILEYLAAGVPPVSTRVGDVAADWGRGDLVAIASGREAVLQALERSITRPRAKWRAEADGTLTWLSWNITWLRMRRLIEDSLRHRRTA